MGHVLGLGDRHPSNILLKRETGTVVHIDFGDCWEIAQRRSKFPERVRSPFLRLFILDATSSAGPFQTYENAYTCNGGSSLWHSAV